MIPVFALLFDALIGDPKTLWAKLPHPAVLMGRLIGWADTRFNDDEDPDATRRVNGILFCIALVIGAFILGKLLQALPFGWLISVILGGILLAQRSLIDHVQAVADGLRTSLRDGQIMVGRIVGRDTSAMDESAVSRAAIESAAENFSDGLVAPLFWFIIGGLPGLLVYKAVNTADSMIGYRTPRHQAFGMAAARVDDALNWIPARLTALLILLANGQYQLPFFLRPDAKLHRSPNAGWPEAAMARILSIALSGPRSYEGEMRDFPWVNENARKNAGISDIESATQVLWKTWGLCLGLALLMAAIRAIC
ncbi:MAG: adenosylcobinamide-phosphate synthase CbiB [Halocynthiibacter sp.]